MRLNCLYGACSNCNTLGGLLSSVLVVSCLQCFGGVGYYKFSLGSVLFVRAVFGWPACLHSGVERVALYGFQLLLARLCDCWWMSMVDGLTRSVFHGRAFRRDFLLCVLVIVSWGAKRCHARVCSPILSYACCTRIVSYGFSGMWLRAHITRVLSLLTHV